MKLGVLTLLFGSKPLEETLDYLQSLGVEAVEFGAGGYVKSGHFATAELLNDDAALRRLKSGIQRREPNACLPMRKVASSNISEIKYMAGT